MKFSSNNDDLYHLDSKNHNKNGFYNSLNKIKTNNNIENINPPNEDILLPIEVDTYLNVNY